MKRFKFRASSLGLIMADAQSIDTSLLPDELLKVAEKLRKTDEEKSLLAPYKEQSLSAGAKTYCEQIAKEFVYGYESTVTSKYLEKGLMVEEQAIELYNEVKFTSLTKNKERRENDWITGEPDLVRSDRIVDIKSSWSLDTFPVTSMAGRDSGYEWQGRAYMWLFDKPAFDLAYCLVNTPDDLIGYEDPALHYVDEIDPALRVTVTHYLRDATLEERIRLKVDSANAYILKVIRQIGSDHQ